MNRQEKPGNRAAAGEACCPRENVCCSGAAADADGTKEAVRDNYAGLIKAGPRSPCCGSGAGLAQLAGYTDEQLQNVPEPMRETIFACGNPVAFAEIEAGQVVLDIGSGAGLDALLAAAKVGPDGKVIGLDMTPQMIEAARANARRAGAQNVEFRVGDAEAMPVEDGSCDWIISNCVINLAPDKPRVFAEAFRALKPGGRLMISDIVAHNLPAEVRRSLAAWTSCIGGAPERDEYLQYIRAAGFEKVEIVGELTYDADLIQAMGGACCTEASQGAATALRELAPEIAGRVSSVRISAVKQPG